MRIAKAGLHPANTGAKQSKETFEKIAAANTKAAAVMTG